MEQTDYLNWSSYPKEVKYWMCSDKQIFPTKKNDEEPERHFAKQREEGPTVYTHEGPGPEMYY